MLRTGGKDILQGRLPQVRMIKIMVITMIRGRAQIALITLIMLIMMMMMIMVTLCRANDDGDDDEFHLFLWHGRLASSPFPPSSGIVGRIVE